MVEDSLRVGAADWDARFAAANGLMLVAGPGDWYVIEAMGTALSGKNSVMLGRICCAGSLPTCVAWIKERCA